MDAAHGSFGVRSIVMLERDRAQKLYSGIVDQRSCTVQGEKRKKVDRRREYMAKEEREPRVLTEIVYKEFKEWCWGCS